MQGNYPRLFIYYEHRIELKCEANFMVWLVWWDEHVKVQHEWRYVMREAAESPDTTMSSDVRHKIGEMDLWSAWFIDIDLMEFAVFFCNDGKYMKSV